MDRGAWQAVAHEVTKSRTRLSTGHSHTHDRGTDQEKGCLWTEADVSLSSSVPSAASESCSDVSEPLHGLYSPWNSQVQSTGVGSLSILQEIFPTQGSNSGLLHCRQILYRLSHWRSTRILEWVKWRWKSLSRVRLFVTPWTTRLLSQWNFPGKSTGVGCHFLLQGIFPTQGSNPDLSYCGQTFYCLSSLSLLPWIFPTQESNRGLLHCRQVLYLLS